MQITQYYKFLSKYKIKNSALICLIAYSFICLFPTKSFAEGISLGVQPAILRIEAIPPADVRAPLTIENQSDEPVKLKIGYKLFRASDKGNGQIEFLKASDPFPGADKDIFEKIELIDDNFSIDSLELGPKQKKKLSLRVVAPRKEPYSDYYFSLIFLADSTPNDADEDTSASDKAGTTTATGGIAVNVLLSIGPKNNPKGYIEEFSTPWYREAGPVPFTLKVKNAGSHFITPKGVILIKNMFGQTVGKVDIFPDNILSGTTRSMTDKPQAQNANSAQANQTPEIIWPETFLLGFYTAELSLAISDQGPLYNNSVHFIALPVKLMLSIAIVIVIIILAYLRVKKKMREKN